MIMPSSVPKSGCAAESGFTLVEMITVMVLIGILSAIGAARYFDRAVFDAAAYTDQTRALIRYGQKVAVAQHRPVHVRLDGNSVALCFNYDLDPLCGAPNRVLAASGGNSGNKPTVTWCLADATWSCEGKPDGVTYTSTPATTSFFFDALGKPYAAGDTAPASAFQRVVINVAGSDGTTRTVTIEAESGHVY